MRTRKKPLAYVTSYQFTDDTFESADALRAMAQFCKRHETDFQPLAVGIDYCDGSMCVVTLTGEWASAIDSGTPLVVEA